MKNNDLPPKNPASRLNLTPFILLAALILSVALTFFFRPRYRENPGEFFWQYFFSVFAASELVIFHLTPPFAALITFLATRKSNYYDSWWFRQRNWEKNLCKAIRLKKWKAGIFTYSKKLFASGISKERVMINMTQSEIVHELIFALSFLPILLGKQFGHFALLAVLCAIFALANVPFILIQRFNRPRIQRSRL